MRRRDFITLLGGVAAWPLTVRAQQPAKVPRIGYLAPSALHAREEAFQRRLQELGLCRKNIVIEYRFAEGKFYRLCALAEELVRLEVDLIVTVVTQASLAAEHATRTKRYGELADDLVRLKVNVIVTLDALPITKEKMIAANRRRTGRLDRSTGTDRQIELRLIQVM
jgi:hypothetical protein